MNAFYKIRLRRVVEKIRTEHYFLFVVLTPNKMEHEIAFKVSKESLLMFLSWFLISILFFKFHSYINDEMIADILYSLHKFMLHFSTSHLLCQNSKTIFYRSNLYLTKVRSEGYSWHLKTEGYS